MPRASACYVTADERRRVYRAVPVAPGLLDQLDLISWMPPRRSTGRLVCRDFSRDMLASGTVDSVSRNASRHWKPNAEDQCRSDPAPLSDSSGRKRVLAARRQAMKRARARGEIRNDVEAIGWDLLKRLSDAERRTLAAFLSDPRSATERFVDACAPFQAGRSHETQARHRKNAVIAAELGILEDMAARRGAKQGRHR